LRQHLGNLERSFHSHLAAEGPPLLLKLAEPLALLIVHKIVCPAQHLELDITTGYAPEFGDKPVAKLAKLGIGIGKLFKVLF